MPESSLTGPGKATCDLLIVNHTHTQLPDSCAAKPPPRQTCGHRVKILSDRMNGRAVCARWPAGVIQADHP
jgi:hypothetical protein